MEFDNRVPLSPYITTHITTKARQLIGKHGFARTDQGDIEQRIALEVVRRRGKFDPSLARQDTFLARLVDHAVADIIAARRAPGRDYRREECSLNEAITGSDGRVIERHETMSDAADGEAEVRDLVGDVQQVLAALPPLLAHIATCLATKTPAETARELNIPRGTLYEHMGRIKVAFRRAGLDGYLIEK